MQLGGWKAMPKGHTRETWGPSLPHVTEWSQNSCISYQNEHSRQGGWQAGRAEGLAERERADTMQLHNSKTGKSWSHLASNYLLLFNTILNAPRGLYNIWLNQALYKYTLIKPDNPRSAQVEQTGWEACCRWGYSHLPLSHLGWQAGCCWDLKPLCLPSLGNLDFPEESYKVWKDKYSYFRVWQLRFIPCLSNF